MMKVVQCHHPATRQWIDDTGEWLCIRDQCWSLWLANGHPAVAIAGLALMSGVPATEPVLNVHPCPVATLFMSPQGYGRKEAD